MDPFEYDSMTPDEIEDDKRKKRLEDARREAEETAARPRLTPGYRRREYHDPLPFEGYRREVREVPHPDDVRGYRRPRRGE